MHKLRPLSAIVASVSVSQCISLKDEKVSNDHGAFLTNWSGTHHFNSSIVHEPEDSKDVMKLLRQYNKRGCKLRPVGTSLSPNGLGFGSDGSAAISLQAMNNVTVDTLNKVVTVGAGARVSDILRTLDNFGLTLENFSSITEQQAGGWTQVAAHGTGATLSTVEEQIVSMEVMTPSGEVLVLSNEQCPHVFKMMRTGLGSLGVVTSLTLRCIPKLTLCEQLTIYDREIIGVGHRIRLKNNRHVRYMWLPYTSDVVCVISNPTSSSAGPTSAASLNSAATKPLVDLLVSHSKSAAALGYDRLSFSELRDRLLDLNPLHTKHVMAVNAAEAQFWRNISVCSGSRIADSAEILGFDCGGQQLVLEVCFPIGSLQQADEEVAPNRDLEFVRDLLVAIETADLPAPCPIEQRWTAASSSPLSPAYSSNPNMVFSWVGIIMYLPAGQSDEQRRHIKAAFEQYTALLVPLCEKYNAYAHWAKVELPKDQQQIANLRRRIADKFPVGEFNYLRRVCDPNNILSNELINALFMDQQKR